jgi:hypothetical protein
MINYETDYYAWTNEQAQLLRAGDLQHIDLKNIIEELETMGRSEICSLILHNIHYA